ncbi:MAG: sensor histidine kinase [Gammaproteobacteria bacterium]
MTIHPLRSSTFRLALAYLAVFFASVLVLMGFLWHSTAGFMESQTDAAIEAEIEGLAERYRSDGLVGLSRQIRERIGKDPKRSSVYLLISSSGEKVVGNLSDWPGTEEGTQDEDGWISFPVQSLGEDGPLLHEARARVFRLRGGDFLLLVGRDLDDLKAVKRLIVEALVSGLAITLALGLVGGLVLSRRMLRRIETINVTSRRIMDGALDERVPQKGTGDDLDQLSGNLNAMLDRIQGLMANVRQVSDNIAHDLKTPLTRLRNDLEMLRSGLNGDAAAAELAERALAEADHLLTTFSALLRIARIESGERRSGFGPVDVSALVADVAEFYEPLADAREQRFLCHVDSGLHLVGDRDLLFQATANLVDNAIKYTPEQGEVMLKAYAEEDAVYVVVSDSGPGIPEDERDKVLRRFYRLEASRGAGGNGLGLSLVQAVVTLHGGHLTFQSAHPGLKAVVQLPRVAG